MRRITDVAVPIDDGVTSGPFRPRITYLDHQPSRCPGCWHSALATADDLPGAEAWPYERKP